MVRGAGDKNGLDREEYTNTMQQISILNNTSYQLPHTGEAAVHDTLTSGPTTQDNQGEPNIFFSFQTPRVFS